MKASEQKFIIYQCYISGIEAKALLPESLEVQSHLILPSLHPILTTDDKTLNELTELLKASGDLTHLHLCAWLVKLSQLDNPLILNLEHLAKRVPNLGDAFANFITPWLQSIYFDLVAKAHIQGSKTYALPKLRLNTFNTSNIDNLESKELIKRSLVAWAKQVKDSLAIAKGEVAVQKPLEENTESSLKYYNLEQKISSEAKTKRLRHLANYLKACLEKRVFATELSAALDALFNLDTVSTTQIKHLRQLVLEHGQENFTDQKLSYDLLLNMITKELAKRDGIGALLSLEAVTKTESTKAQKFQVLAPKASPKASPKPKPNLMLAALKRRQQGQ